MFHFKRFFFVIAVFVSTCLRTPLYGLEATDPIENDYMVNRDECLNAANSSIVKEACCQLVDLNDKAANICLQRMVVNPNEPKMVKMKYLSATTECIYKKRNYIKAKNRLNMGAIKAEAKKLYHNDSLNNDYFVNMYRVCGRQATTLFNKIHERPRGDEFLKELHNPYYLLVFLCTQDYSKANCPYYRWKGRDESSIENCMDYVNQCKDRYFENPNMYSINKENVTQV